MTLFPSMVAGLLVLVAVLWAKLDDWIPDSWSGEDEAVVYEVRWKEWSPGLVELHRERGQIVLLMFTAQWDMSHVINKKRIFSNQKVLKKLSKHELVLIRADHTLRSPAILKELQRYGRSHLPTTVVAPGDPDAAVILLPELLNPEDVIEAVEGAARVTKSRNWFELK